MRILRDFTEAKRGKSKAKQNYRWRTLPFVEPQLDNENHSDGSNLGHCLLIAFNDLEGQKHNIFLEKQLSKNPMELP